MNGLLKQPRSVWAVAFAAVVAFMGIGLVDPILSILGRDLDATHAQVELLFTSYFAVTAVAMLVSGWVSSRIGARRTLLTGLALVVVFSALAGASGTIGEIVGFRAGWGLGNALFIATALSVIVGAASGGVAGAIILYEAALGLGIASGPLLGGLLGGISWRGPFFGTAALMAIGFVAITVLLPKNDAAAAPRRRTGITEPIRALGHKGLRTLAVTAVLYNYGFFTLLAFTPLVIVGLTAIQLGFVFFAWGLLVAITSVFVAPRLRARTGTTRGLMGVLGVFSLVLFAMAIGTGSNLVLILGVIASGALLGLVNTMLTEAVMKVAPDVERPIASSAYNFVRFGGGAIAPYLAGVLSDNFNPHLPFLVGGVAVALTLIPLGRSHALLAHVDDAEAGHTPQEEVEETLGAEAGIPERELAGTR